MGLYSDALQESSTKLRGQVVPWPRMLNVAGKGGNWFDAAGRYHRSAGGQIQSGFREAPKPCYRPQL